ncbi:MAG: citrate transporter [Clostridiales bacterium GWF2_36_10]|nr:MAG: citrate transporter [Clostridiales bacterium GWF2_36_10]HAN21511.1 citrate transporter [Clostridiales bacterium]
MQISKEEGLKFLNVIYFTRRNTVFFIALIAAIISAFFVPFDKEYVSYFDFKTLTCLFCVLAVVCALRNINFFSVLARKTVAVFHNTRIAIIGIVYITLIGSMLITNDMALITFLPLSYFILVSTKKQKYMAFTFIMQNFAANLGGMITPFGNPQNLFLYSRFSIPSGEFMRIMLPHFLFSVFLITICCLFIKPDPLTIPEEKQEIPKGKTIIYLILFVLSVAIVFRGVPYIIGLIIVPIVLYFLDKKALSAVDYPLLFTFVCFFIFAGNMARIDAVMNLFTDLLEKSTLISSIVLSQFISNVPAAILLSQFTQNYSGLLVGVNIGGAGTLISSLASLITLKEYIKYNPGKTGKYILLFTLYNIGFLVLFTAFALILR